MHDGASEVLNALHPPPGPQDAGRLTPWPDARRALRLLSRLNVCYVAVAAILLLWTLGAAPLAAELRSSGLAGVAIGAILLSLTGLLATLPMAWARQRAGQTVPASLASPVWPQWARVLRPGRIGRLDATERLARMARRPQGIIVPALSFAAAAWWLWPGMSGPASHATLLGGGAIALTFPLLVAERIIAGVPAAQLPEAAALQALLFVPVAVVPLAGLIEIMAGLGMAWPRLAMAFVFIYLCVIAAELAARSLANWFLPPPSHSEARASVASLAALLLQAGLLRPNRLATPIRDHLGVDFSRSWALRYVRSAILPIAAFMVLTAWGLTGVSLINLDQRGVYERFGAPVAVWAPGAHLGLPWPLGQVRRVEFGVVHAIPLGGEDPASAQAGAEGAAPASADRLWDRAHPAEVSYLIASLDSGGQSFQVVSVDLRVLYRFGLDDTSARSAAFAVAAPEALVRAEAGRLLARVFARKLLGDVLGERRESLAETLRVELQAELDRLGSGIELVGLMIEAIHPPAAAAEAYHNVQAAEIVANTATATERGRAQAAAAAARQTSTDLIAGSRGAAAETVGQANTTLRTFTADQDAARGGGQAFLLERYFANLSTALAKSPLVIVDHRLGGASAPVIDLRSFGAPAARSADED